MRSLVFNSCFFLFNAIYTIGYIWGLLLPQKWYRIGLVPYYKGVHLMEKYILGLDYKVVGIDNLPKENGYIVASKHQSTYETFKYFLLIPNLVFILKKELLNIPIWGWHARKLGFIGIDRSSATKSIKSLKLGVEKALKKGKNILIFPQGTRVLPTETTEDKPYKAAATKLYQYGHVPVIPVAMNSGEFWPRKSFTKKPGVVTFRFLKPIQPGIPPKEFIKQLENVTETACQKL